MKKIITANSQTSYRIEKGSAQIFLIPSSKSLSMRQMYVGTAGQGVTIPGLSVTEENEDGLIEWHLFIKAESSTIFSALIASENDSRLFLKSIGYKIKSNNKRDLTDDFWSILREDYYYLRDSKADGVKKTIEQNRSSFSKNARTIQSVFSLSKESESIRNLRNTEELYAAMEFLCKYSKIDIVEYEKLLECGQEYTVEDIARLSGFDIRSISLPDDYATGDIGPVLAFASERMRPIVITTKARNKKHYFDPQKGEMVALDDMTVKEIHPEAYQIYRPLGDGAFNGKAFFRFAMKEVRLSDFVPIIAGMALISYISIAISNLNRVMYDKMIPQGDAENLLAYGGVLVSFMIASLLFSIAQSTATFRLSSRLKYSLQASIYGRVFRMQESFYRNRDAGELSYRIGILSGCYMAIFNSVTSMIMQLIFSLIYLFKMYSYSTGLGTTGLLVSLVSGLAVSGFGFIFQKVQSKRSNLTAKKRALLYQIFSGISSVRMAGAEENLLGLYMKKEAEFGSCDYEYSFIQRISSSISLAAGAVSTIVIYFIVAESGISMSMGSFMGFISVYGFFSAAFLQLANAVMMLFRMLPILKDSSDILKTAPETTSKGLMISDLKGKIDLSHVSFGYNKTDSPVLKDINLSIAPGEYVAIVGSSGCGKSTLVRLLLGFEKPGSGQIYYDNANLETINKVQLRRKIGVVLQDGGLFSGSIYRNIKLASPNATNEDIEEAVDMAQLRSVIDSLPMGLMTPVSETAVGISGGQMQRILIARAIAKKPQVMIFDEATSALDNVTQAKISENISRLKATRIVIAHRLSTVMNCDRIIVLNNGRIAETGKYDELIAKQGIFYQLVREQMV